MAVTTSSSPAVSLRGLEKHYDDVVAVAGIDLVVPRGECFGLLGPNGAGKTTTIEICEGLTDPTAGEVTILGLDHRKDPQQIRTKIGISLQETKLTDKLTVEETVRLFRSFYPVRRGVDDVIAADLNRSGRFRPIPEDDMLQKPDASVDLDFDDWSILGVEAVEIGRASCRERV